MDKKNILTAMFLSVNYWVLLDILFTYAHTKHLVDKMCVGRSIPFVCEDNG